MIKSYNKYIYLTGTPAKVARGIEILDQLDLKNNEAEDRLMIQKAIGKERINIVYYGNHITSLNIIKEFKKLQKLGTLEKMSEDFYNFMRMNFDIAYYNKQGYISEYGNSFKNLYDRHFDRPRMIPSWKTDVLYICKCLNICGVKQ